MLSRCRNCPATALRDASGPTIALSRAAERATIKRHGTTKEYMFVNRYRRRRLQRHVGPGHGRRRTFGVSDREHGRDTTVAEAGSDVTRRDRATGHTTRDPARDYLACDRPYGTRSGDGRYGTRQSSPTPCPATGHTACDDHRVFDDVWRPGGAAARWPEYVLLCPVMSGYARLCPVIPGYVRLCPVMSGYV